MYNLAVIIGRLPATPEIKTTPSGTSVCTFTVACDRAFKNADGEKVTDFIPCVAWRNNAEFISKYFSKGSAIGVHGNIQVRPYTDKEGNKRTATEILVDRAFFVGSKETNGANVERNTGGFDPVLDDSADIPF